MGAVGQLSAHRAAVGLWGGREMMAVPPQAAAGTPTAVAERSLLGPTANILCSAVPIYWA